MVRLAVALALTAALAAAADGSPSAANPPIRSFTLTGGKVTCVMTGGQPATAGALCLGTLNKGVKPFPRPNCHGTGDPGGGLSIGTTGRSRGLCLSENPIVPPVKLLAYGKSISLGGVTCKAVSATVGVRCTNRTRHGFQMSRYGWKQL